MHLVWLQATTPCCMGAAHQLRRPPARKPQRTVATAARDGGSTVQAAHDKTCSSRGTLTAATAACEVGSIVHTLLYTSGTKKFQYSRQILNTCWEGRVLTHSSQQMG